MIDELTEFQIAQLADGTLDERSRVEIEALIGRNEEARAIFESYRRLDSALSGSLRITPNLTNEIITSDEVIGHIDARSARAAKIGWWRSIGSIAAAACVFVMISGGLRQIWPSEQEAIETLAQAPLIRVRGPMSILSANRPGDTVINVSIGEPVDLSLDRLALLYDDPMPGGHLIVIGGIGRIE